MFWKIRYETALLLPPRFNFQSWILKCWCRFAEEETSVFTNFSLIHWSSIYAIVTWQGNTICSTSQRLIVVCPLWWLLLVAKWVQHATRTAVRHDFTSQQCRSLHIACSTVSLHCTHLVQSYLVSIVIQETQKKECLIIKSVIPSGNHFGNMLDQK